MFASTADKEKAIEVQRIVAAGLKDVAEIEGKVSKKGVKLSFTEEVIADSLWDIVGLHVRAAGHQDQRSGHGPLGGLGDS